MTGEAQRSLPGDELVADAKIGWTHAITIHARPGEIWPWLVQMGCRRAGWYSYDGLDNGGAPSADRIIPEFPDAAYEPEAFCARVARTLEHEIAGLLGQAPADRLAARLARYRRLGTG